MTLNNLLKIVPEFVRFRVWDTKKKEYVFKGKKKAICNDVAKQYEVEFIDSALEEDVQDRTFRAYVGIYVHKKGE